MKKYYILEDNEVSAIVVPETVKITLTPECQPTLKALMNHQVKYNSYTLTHDIAKELGIVVCDNLPLNQFFWDGKSLQYTIVVGLNDED